MWIAKNKDGRVGLFTDRPFRYNDCQWATKHGWYMQLDDTESSNFLTLSWDNEPIEVSLVPTEDIVDDSDFPNRWTGIETVIGIRSTGKYKYNKHK